MTVIKINGGGSGTVVEVSLAAFGLSVNGAAVVGVFNGVNFLGRTEVGSEDANPTFDTKLEIEYAAGDARLLTFSIYDTKNGSNKLSADAHLGACSVSLSDFDTAGVGAYSISSGGYLSLTTVVKSGGGAGGQAKAAASSGGKTTVEMPEDAPVEQGMYRSFDDDFCHGAQAPDLSKLDWVTGEEVARPQAGQVTVVLLWAQFSKAGFKYLPLYSELQKKFQGHVTVVGLSQDVEKKSAKKFLDDPAKKYSSVFPLTFAVAWDEGRKLKEQFADAQRGVVNLITAYVIDSEGVIRWHQDHSQIGATAPDYMDIMEAQVARLILGKPLQSVGKKPEAEEEEEDSDDMPDMPEGGDDDFFF